MYIENIVIGSPIVQPSEIFAKDENDWNNVEREKTYFTNERYLPKILVEIGAYPSISEIRRNRKDLVVTLDSLAYFDKLKIGKKKYVYILVGE